MASMPPITNIGCSAKIVHRPIGVKSPIEQYLRGVRKGGKQLPIVINEIPLYITGMSKGK
jgi:hypothetical protein